MGGGRRGSQLQNMGLGMSSLDAEKAKERVNGESALDTDEDDSSPERNLPADVKNAVHGLEGKGVALQDDSAVADDDEDENALAQAHEEARRLGRRMSEAMEGAAGSDEREKVTQITREQTDKDKSPPATPATFFSPSDLAARLNENPKLSALRQESFGGASSPGGRMSVSSPPILMNPKCSGYFVEPVSVV